MNSDPHKIKDFWALKIFDFYAFKKVRRNQRFLGPQKRETFLVDLVDAQKQSFWHALRRTRAA